MRVVTIDGGFRGLAAIPQRSHDSALDDFTRSIQAFDDTFERFSIFRQRGELSSSDESLMHEYEQVSSAVGAHIAQINAGLESMDDLAAWRERSALLLSQATSWSRRARYVMGEEAENRGLRIFLLAAASITVLGGGMYVFYRATKPRRRRR